MDYQTHPAAQQEGVRLGGTAANVPVEDKQAELRCVIYDMDVIVGSLTHLLDRMTGNDRVEKVQEPQPEPPMDTFRDLMNHGPEKLREQRGQMEKLLECITREIF